MSDSRLLSELKGMRQKFWQERQHLQQDEIKRQWAAEAALYTDILLDTEAQTRPLDLASTQGQQMVRQSTSEPWAQAAMRRRGSDIVTPIEFGQRYHDALSSEPMCRKRARTSQFGPGAHARNATSAPSLETSPWQLDNNPPYYGYTNTSTSGPSFKARRTSAGRMPMNIPETSPSIRVYEPEEFLQQSGAFQSSSFHPITRPQAHFNNHFIPPSPLELTSPLSSSPTTTVSERFTDTSPATSAAMSRQDSLATSFCGAFDMMRANSGVSGMDLDQMCRQDSGFDPYSKSFSPVSTPYDPSIYFAHAEGTAADNSSASMLAVEQLQLPTTLELDTDMQGDVSTSSMFAAERVQPPSSLKLLTKMIRDPSSESNVSSASRISRRSQEQVAQAAARPIAPKDVDESQMSKQSSSLLCGGQDMLRQRSAPEAKMLIPKLQYSPPNKEKLKCDRCNKNPDGYRGSHELHRHMALDHNSTRIAWVCVDVSTDGFLSGCAACESKKPYGQDYNAAAHLRRFHFHPKSEVRRTNVDPEQRRGGKGGGKDPPMSECRRWMKKVEVPGKDFAGFADSALDDAGDIADEDDVEYKEEQEKRDEVAIDTLLTSNVQTNGNTLQPHDAIFNRQISASHFDGPNSLDLPGSSDRQMTPQRGDGLFSEAGLQSAFEAAYRTDSDSNAKDFHTSSTDSAYFHPTLSSSAPAAPSFLRQSSADPAYSLDSFANSTPDPVHLPRNVSTIGSAHVLEDFIDFQTSQNRGHLSYEMPSSNNHYGLIGFPPLR